MKHVILLIAMFSSPIHAIAKWTPPEKANKADAQAIIREAFADTRNGNYEDSLAKHVWYHQHALEIEPALVGSRLAPALTDWSDLAKAYPPAMAKLRETRDDAVKQVVSRTGDVRQAFQDLASINENLGDDKQTADLFVRLDNDSPESAKTLYDLAQAALVKDKLYPLCGKYLQAKEAFDNVVEAYKLSEKYDAEKKGESVEQRRISEEVTERFFLRESAVLIALLKLNARDAEARRIADEVIKMSRHPKRQLVVDAALQGQFPVLEWENNGQ